MSNIKEGWHFIDDTISVPKNDEQIEISYVKVTALYPNYRVEYYDSDLTNILTTEQSLITIHPLIKTSDTTTKPYLSSSNLFLS